VPGEVLEPPRRTGRPAGLSRLRLPFRHPGERARLRGRGVGGLRASEHGTEQHRAQPVGGLAAEAIGLHDAFDHVARRNGMALTPVEELNDIGERNVAALPEERNSPFELGNTIAGR